MDIIFFFNLFRPIATHYFPTLHQYQYELEEGRTPRGTKARFDYQEDIFPNYSWRGYVVLSALQVWLSAVSLLGSGRSICRTSTYMFSERADKIELAIKSHGHVP